jgi:hypothetical protein
MSNTIPIEAAGWISHKQFNAIMQRCEREKVWPGELSKHFGVIAVSELQQEDFFDALVFIGKNSKE